MFCYRFLFQKHLHGRDAAPHVLHDCTNKEMLQSSYSQCLTGDIIKKAANHTDGAAELSVVDECAWQWIYTSFGDASTS